MRIQHNIPALNAYRNYNNNASALSKNLEKLSSGYRINRAGDDAAGLAISEKMRAQITGLDAAQKNVKDGISLVKTAEGAMQEVQDMLNRMTYLATQSANGTYDNEVDRKNLQKEVNELCTEINRIADSTNFNGIKLLDGSLGINEDSAVSNVKISNYQKASSDLDAFNVRFVSERPDSAASTKASFEVSLNNLKITNPASNSAGTHTITLQIGDTSITVKATGSAMSASQLAKALASAGKGLASATDKNKNTLSASTGKFIKIDNNTYKMTAVGSKIKFTQVNVMEKGADRVNPNFSVSVTVDAAKGYVNDGGVNPQVQNPKQGIADGGSQQARVDVEIDFSKLKDGDKLTVGSTTYVFKIGEKSTTTAAGGEKLVDLSKTFKKDEDMSNTSLQNQAMGDIARAMATNASWSVGNAPIVGTTGTLTFQSIGSHGTGFKDLSTQDKVMKQFTSSAEAKNASVSFDFDATKLKAGDTITVGDVTYEFTNGSTTTVEGRVAVDISAALADGTIKDSETSAIKNDFKAAIERNLFAGGSASDKMFSVNIDEDKITITAQDNDMTAGVFEEQNAVRLSVGGSGLSLQIGDTAESFNKLNVAIDDMHVESLGLSGIDISTQPGAEEAIEKIKGAINLVSQTRGTLGANQNRLEHTTNNLSIMKENITDAESAIRDTDVADEMTKYTKNNILLQSAQAMLAQANQLPQGVLQLLG